MSTQELRRQAATSDLIPIPVPALYPPASVESKLFLPARRPDAIATKCATACKRTKYVICSWWITRSDCLGVVSDRDLGGKSQQRAEELMAHKPQACCSATPLCVAVTRLLQSHISSLPVVDGEKLVGIVTITDVALCLQVSLRLFEQFIGSLISDPASIRYFQERGDDATDDLSDLAIFTKYEPVPR